MSVQRSGVEADEARVADLRRAIDDDELVVHYQPKLALTTRRVYGVEALVRWAHPTRGLVGPGAFVPLAERVRLVGAIDLAVLRKACAQVAAWRVDDGPARDVSVAVNFSAVHLGEDDLVAPVAAVLRDTGMPPERLELEITETAVMSDVDAAIAVLQRLKDLGVRLAIDDFGTGYSSLNYLKRLPVDTLKIDRSFIAGLGRDRQDSAVVRAVIALSEAFRMTSVAEGVETFEQLVELGALGCDAVQGYLLGRPAPAEHALAQISVNPGERAVQRVLVCDDDPTVRVLYRAAFEREAVLVEEAADGAECIAAAMQMQPDLVTLDLSMPNLNGMAALRELRAVCPNAAVMFVSATTAQQAVAEGFDAGAVAYFAKEGFLQRIPVLLREYARIAPAAG